MHRIGQSFIIIVDIVLVILKEQRWWAEHLRKQVGSRQFNVGVDFQPERFVLYSLISRSEERVTFFIAFWFGLSQFSR